MVDAFEKYRVLGATFVVLELVKHWSDEVRSSVKSRERSDGWKGDEWVWG
jgi:hypothetical protein